MKSLYGLSKPYNFYRAFPFLIAIALLLLIVSVMGGMAIFGKLNWGTYRFIYYIYIASVALVAAALSFAPVVAWLLIAFCFIEFSLGVSTALLAEMHVLTTARLPKNILYESREPLRFQYHPLLQGTLKPNFLRSLPFKVQHDSYGLRGAERDEMRLKQQIVIAVLGGSTTYDFANANGQTWPDELERKLGNEFAVLNHGVIGYSTVENLIQTLFYLNSYGVKPRCAVYYIGWNDIRNAHVPNLDPAFANFHLLSQVGNLGIRSTPRREPLLGEISPLGRIIIHFYRAWTQLVEIIPMPEQFSDREPEQGGDIRLEQIFRSNIQAIAAINNQRGIISIFVGQVLNRARLRASTPYGWLPLVRDVDVWPLMEHFNTILDATAKDLGSPSFVPPIDKFEDSDFVDNGHFSPEGAQKFVAMLTPLVRAKCHR
jgi:lysophospholipase L1-like esterase